MRTLTEDEYDSFEEAIASSSKGRAFLREHARRQRMMSVDEVKRVVYQIRDDIDQRAGASGTGRLELLRAELNEMAASITETKRQIAALQPQDDGQNRIMAATGELDAIVSATERATSEIIAQAEALMSLAETARGSGDATLAGKMEAAATEILMACSFQDITGQRTNKVVNAMRYLEQRINAMVAIWGDEALANVLPIDDDVEGDRRPDAHLLNGPAADGEGIDQNDVDALFAEPTPEKAEPPPKPANASLGQDDIDSLFS